MQPMRDLVNRQAGFVSVQHRLLREDLDQALFKWLQGLVLLLAGALQSAFTDRIAEHFGAHFPDPSAGSDLGVVEVSQQRAEILPILDRGFDPGGKGRRHGAFAAGAVFDFGPILGAFQLEGGQIIDLAGFVIDDGLMAQILPASLTVVQGVDLNVVGILGEGKRATGMVGLTAGFAPRFGSQALGLGPLTSISGWGTGTIAAILRGGVLQVAQPALELEGVIDQALQVAFAPLPELLTGLIE